jgi:hypothetical protein
MLPLTVIACKIFQGLIESYLPPETASRTTFLDYGLHATPKKLKLAVQEQIDALSEPSLVLLGYGLCGNGLDKIHARTHTLLIPRTDDCIGVLLGSYQRYREEFDTQPGTYYLTKGWLEAGSNPLQEYEQMVAKYGQAMADYIIDTQYKHYKRLALVAHTPEDMAYYRPQAQQVAQFCERWGVVYTELLGSKEYVVRLAALAVLLSSNGGELPEGRQVPDDFLIVPPGGELRQALFLR